MFVRGISADNVEGGIAKGDIIRQYQEDKPYPSFLVLYFIQDQPLHIVVSQNVESGKCYIITTYLPDPDSWDIDFKRKKKYYE